MEIKTGIDILEKNRIKHILADKKRKEVFIKKVFTSREIETFSNNKIPYYELNFSFKESIWKAIPENIQKKVYFKNIEILWKDDKLDPYLLDQKLKNAHLAFTQTKKHIITTAIIL